MNSVLTVWSKGAVGSAPENSQIMAAPVTLADGVIVTLVAPEWLFFAYQMSIICRPLHPRPWSFPLARRSCLRYR